MAEKKQPEAAAAPAAEATAAAAPAGDGSLLDQIIDKGKMARDESQKSRAKDLVGEFVHQILDEGMTVSRDTLAMIQAQIARIDELLSKQLNEVLHHPDFQKLEASWRGLHFFVMNTETSTRLKLRLLCATKAEVFKDLDQAIEFDQSVLFKKVYEEEYGTFGGNPFSLLMGDYEFGRHPQDMALLEKISGVAAAAHAPFISAASPRLFDMDAFTELANPRDLAKLFESTELIKWRSFQSMEDSRYVTLVLPHILMRLPYGPNTVPTEDFKLVEDTDGTDHSRYVWGNAVWALGQRITNAFALYGWCAAIRGVEGGGMVSGLPTHTFKTDEGDIALKCPTELAITDRREKELDTIRFALPLQGHRLRGVLRRTDHAEAEAVRHERRQCQRAHLGAVAVRPGGIAFRALPQGHLPRQSRQLPDQGHAVHVSEPLDQFLHPGHRRRRPGAEGAVSVARSAHRRLRRPRQAGRIPRGGVPAPPLPTRGTDRIHPAGC
jgi:type VI secretion system ImpC/EvpB family protein